MLLVADAGQGCIALITKNLLRPISHAGCQKKVPFPSLIAIAPQISVAFPGSMSKCA